MISILWFFFVDKLSTLHLHPTPMTSDHYRTNYLNEEIFKYLIFDDDDDNTESEDHGVSTRINQSKKNSIKK
jgi:hypothetical protein